MKRVSTLFPITCLLLMAAGASGLVMDFMIAVEKMKDPDCPKFLAILVILTGLAWAVAALIMGLKGYKAANKIILQQRRARAGRRNPGRLSERQLGAGAIWIIAICAVQMIFALLTGLKSWQLLYFLFAGIVIPYLFMINGKVQAV